MIRLLRFKLGYKPGLLLAAGVVFGLLLAACGGPDHTQTAPESSAATTAGNAASNSEAAAEVLSSASGSSDAESSHPAKSMTISAIESGPSLGVTNEGFLYEGQLDPDAIVAAHEKVLVRIYEDLTPSVVHIRVSQQLSTDLELPDLPGIPGVPLPEFPEEFFHRGEGSGFVWDDQGHVVTNSHVVTGVDTVSVIFADRTEIQAEVIGHDPGSDLAVLKLKEPKEDARPVELGDSEALKVGQIVVAIGNPFGQEFSMSTGIVSAVGRTIRGNNTPFSIPQVIQTDAPINPGNSGGPLLDRLGRVIGVNTQIISRSGVSSGVGFSVPVNTAKLVIPALIEDGQYEYPWLGITGVTLLPEVAEEMDLPKDTRGALVTQVNGDSPAARAGLRGSDTSFTYHGVELPVGGDVIVAINGTQVRDMDDLITYLVSKTRPGDKVTLEVLREGDDRQTLEVTLGKRPESG